MLLISVNLFVSLRILNAHSDWCPARTVIWSLLLVSLKSTRTIVAHGLSLVRTASATWCCVNRLYIPPYVEASHHLKRRTTAGWVAPRQSESLQMHGLKLTPSGTSSDPKKEAWRIITLVRQLSSLFLQRLILQCTTLQEQCRLQETGRMLHRRTQGLATVSAVLFVKRLGYIYNLIIYILKPFLHIVKCDFLKCILIKCSVLSRSQWFPAWKQQ